MKRTAAETLYVDLLAEEEEEMRRNRQRRESTSAEATRRGPPVEVIELDTDEDAEVPSVSCGICLGDVPVSRTVKLSCGHGFCNECSQTYVKTSIEEGKVLAFGE